MVIGKIITYVSIELHGAVGTFEGRPNVMQDWVSQRREVPEKRGP